jgi:hypothetical protein
MTSIDPRVATGGGITLEGDPALLDELAQEEVELLIEEDILDLSMAAGEERLSSVAIAQGITYVATGLWPLVHLRSFEAVTGRKREKWLVKTVGVLVTVIGATLLVGARRRAGERTTRVLGVTSAAALAGVAMYFADAALELAFAVGWLRTK